MEGTMLKSFCQLLDSTVTCLEHKGCACSISCCWAIWREVCVSLLTVSQRVHKDPRLLLLSELCTSLAICQGLIGWSGYFFAWDKRYPVVHGCPGCWCLLPVHFEHSSRLAEVSNIPVSLPHISCRQQLGQIPNMFRLQITSRKPLRFHFLITW